MLLLFMCNDFKRALVSVSKLFWHSFSFHLLYQGFFFLQQSGKNKLVLFLFFILSLACLILLLLLILSLTLLRPFDMIFLSSEWRCRVRRRKEKKTEKSLLLLHISMTSLLWSYGILYSISFFLLLDDCKGIFSLFW